MELRALGLPAMELPKAPATMMTAPANRGEIISPGMSRGKPLCGSRKASLPGKWRRQF
jgi:hypothetical protein